MNLNQCLIVFLLLTVSTVSTNKSARKSKKTKNVNSQKALNLKLLDREDLNLIPSNLSTPTTRRTSTTPLITAPYASRETFEETRTVTRTTKTTTRKNSAKKVPRITEKRRNDNKIGKSNKKFGKVTRKLISVGSRLKTTTTIPNVTNYIKPTPISTVTKTITIPITTFPTVNPSTNFTIEKRDSNQTLQKDFDQEDKNNKDLDDTEQKEDVESIPVVKHKERPKKSQEDAVVERVVETTNSYNNIHSTDNVNNNNYYFFGSQLEELIERLPMQPPQMKLPPPPLPAFLLGCQTEQYEWKLVKKVQNDFNWLNETKGKNETAEGSKENKCNNIIQNLNEHFFQGPLKQIIDSKKSAPVDEKLESNTEDFIKKDESKIVTQTSDFETKSTMPVTPQGTPADKNNCADESRQTDRFLNLMSVKDAESMKMLGLPEGSIIYRKDLKVPFIMADKWRALLLSECGDGVVDAKEECDDGNSENADMCKDDCKLNVCGDGIRRFDEECDGNDFATYPGSQALERCGQRELSCSEVCSVLC